MFPESGFCIALNQPQIRKIKIRHSLPALRHRHFFFDVVVFVLSSLVTVPSFMSIS